MRNYKVFRTTQNNQQTSSKENPVTSVSLLDEVGAVIFDKGILDEHPTDKKEFYSMLTALNRPSSVGHLELSSSDPFAHPKIFLNYYDKLEDLYRMMSRLKLSRKILEQTPLSTDWGVEVIGLDEVNDDKEWEKYICKR
ncbi:13813_t:CDS:2, partial [Gigaspora rosea]